MIKVLLVSASFLFAALSAGLLLQYQKDAETDYADVFDITEISYVSAPVETVMSAPAQIAPSAQPILQMVETRQPASNTRPRSRPSRTSATVAAPSADATTYRSGTLAVLSNLNGGTPTASENAGTQQATSADNLQMLIARSLARNDTDSGDNTNSYIANLNTEAQDRLALVTARGSDPLRAAIAAAPTASANDSAYLALLNESITPLKRVTQATTYTVKHGDNLARISYIHYGRTADYVAILHANQHLISRPDHIMVGQTLIIPVL